MADRSHRGPQLKTIIDIGNSNIKMSQVNSAGQFSSMIRRPVKDFNPQVDLALPTRSRVIIGRSGSHENLASIIDYLNQIDAHVLILEKTARLSFSSHYVPGQAGIDRLANVAAVIERGPGATIVIDAGSAITLEVISHEHVFLGGAILPGVRLQLQSLTRNTADLPGIIQSGTVPPPVATDTAAAIRSGVIYGIAGAINHLINLAAHQLNNPGPRLVLTGGDAELLCGVLPEKDFTVIPELTLRGLNILANYQESQ